MLLENKGKFMLVHSSSGFKHSLKGKIPLDLKNQINQILSQTTPFPVPSSAEVLQDPAVVAKMSDTKAAGEVKALEQFYTTLQCEPAKAFYGKKHVLKAADAQAIETLLISDNLFR